jgi:hypothetical protein
MEPFDVKAFVQLLKDLCIIPIITVDHNEQVRFNVTLSDSANLTGKFLQ